MILRTGAAKDTVLDRSVYKRLGSVLKQYPLRSASASVNFRSGYNAYLSVLHAVNSLAAQGAVPEQINTCILLPEGTDEQILRDIEDQIREACLQTQLTVAGGHTEVTSAVTRPLVTVVCTGKAADLPDLSPASGEMDILLTKWIGLEGTWLLACEKNEELAARFPYRMIMRAKKMKDYLSVSGDAAAALKADPGALMVSSGTGGLYAALWKLSDQLSRGFEIDTNSLPILQETIEITEHFGIDPFEMASLGSLLIATHRADILVNTLESAGIHAAVIGRTRPGKEMLLNNGEETGCLNMPSPDSLLKVLG